MIKKYFASVLFLFCFIFVLAANTEIPPLTGYVNDTAGILSTGTRRELTEMLTSLEASDSTQLFILTISSLNGEAIEDFSMRTAEAWKAGQKGKDNGIIFIIAVKDRKTRIEVGYGLESVITDAECGQILDQIIPPFFRAGDYDGGVKAAVNAMIQIVRGEFSNTEETTESGTSFLIIFFAIVFIVSFLSLFSTGCSSWVFYLFCIPAWFGLPLFIFDSVFACFLIGFAYLIIFPILKIIFPTIFKNNASYAILTSAIESFINSVYSSSGKGGSGGSFGGGGGGGFGGGGASGGW